MAKHAYVDSTTPGTKTDAETRTLIVSDAYGSGDLVAANMYASIKDAITYGGLTAGDFIRPSNISAESYSVTTNIILPDGVTIISMDDTDGSVYKKGATIRVTSGNVALTTNNPDGGVFTAVGLVFDAEDDVSFYGIGTKYYIEDYYIKTFASSDEINVISDGVDLLAKNGSIAYGNANAAVNLSGGSRARFINVNFDDSVTLNNLFDIGINGGANLIIEDSDLSTITVNDELIVQNLGADDICNVTVNRVKVGTTNLYSDTVRTNRYFDFYSVDTGSGYHTFNHSRREGDVLESTSVYRVGGSYYKDGAPTTSNFSAQFVPNSNVVEYTNPLEIKIADIELDLTSVNTLTFQLAFGDDSIPVATLTNAEAWIKLVQNDATDLALGVNTESKPATIATTPTDLASSSETWTGLTHANTDKRQIVIDTVAVPTMTNGQVTAYLCIAKYIDTLEIFGCAKPDIT